jgi:hypothetical protein
VEARLAVFNRRDDDVVAARLVSLPDPLTGRNQDIRQYQSSSAVRTTGIEASASARLGQALQVRLAYAYQDANFELAGFSGEKLTSPVSWSRPHQLSAGLALRVPSDWRRGSALGFLLANLEVDALSRFASGTAYTGCETGGNESVLSGAVCDRGGFTGGLNGARLPTFKQLDLRLARGFGLGRQRLVVFADARNLLNFRNVQRLFVTTGTTTSDQLAGFYFAGDSGSNAAEAERNGIRNADGSIDLRFGGAGASGCGTYTTATGSPSAPNCVYMVRAEERFGDGDGIFDLTEQQQASSAYYQALFGEQLLTGSPRRVRFGLSVEF